MNASKEKKVQILLSAPSGVTPAQPLRIKVGESFPVRANLKAENVVSCEARLVFDQAIFEELSGSPNPQVLVGTSIESEVAWELRVIQRVPEATFVRVEARADNLYQQSEFKVEVS